MISVVDPSAPTADDDQHRYNDDLLLDDEKRKHARHEFPEIFDVLDDETLRLAFKPIDDDANAAKRKSHEAGILAVVAATLALMGASAEPLWHDFPERWKAAIVFVSAALGLASVAIAYVGVIHGTRKDKWLFARFRTERLRQFHFQAWIWTLPAIAQSCDSKDAAAAYKAKRDEEVTAYVSDLAAGGRAELQGVLKPEGVDECWLYDATHIPVIPRGFDPALLFRAYRKLRFKEQVGYADHKLTQRGITLRLIRAPMRDQQQLLRAVWVVSFSMLVLLHTALLVGTIAGSLVGMRDVALALERPVLHVVTVWTAFLALAAKTLEEGLGLSHEIERYEDYRAEVLDARHRFDRGTKEEKLRAMIDMERIAFDEMRSFLRTMKRSSFVV